MIGQSDATLIGQPLGNRIDLFTRQAINNPGIVGMLGFNKLPKLLFSLIGFGNGIKNIAPVKTVQIDIGVMQIELFDDFNASTFIRRGGQRNTRDIRKAFMQHAQLLIFRAKIMAPLRHTMRFINGKQ